MTIASPLLTQFRFTLPRGLVDRHGTPHHQGIMRLATARDELIAQRHPQVQATPDYLPLVLLSQVTVQLGTMETVLPEDLENLLTRDLAYLREFYNQINQTGSAQIPVQCPQCNHAFHRELLLSGEPSATPWINSTRR